MSGMQVDLRFDHGLGDCANFAHVLELYRRRGVRVRLHCAADKEPVFSPLGLEIVPTDFPGLRDVGYPEALDVSAEIAERYWLYNKVGINACLPPLPVIGTAEELWDELCAVRLDTSPFVPGPSRLAAERFLAPLPRPIVLLHTMGNTLGEYKNVPADATLEIYRRLLDRTDGTLVLLDWDDRVPRLAGWRVRHMTDDWERADVWTLLALMEASDLLVSVDSGPLHLARMTDVPVVGLFPTPTTYPSRMMLPRERTACVVPRGTREVNAAVRALYNVVESPVETGVDPQTIAEACARMLAGPRYLDRRFAGADVQLQQFVLDWERGSPSPLTPHNDRDRGFDLLLRETRARFAAPAIVETGCVRAEEDWGGAGYGTYLLGAFVHRHGGKVVSVDLDAGNCAFARRATRAFPCVEVVEGDSVPFLRDFGRPIDALVLDSMDTDVPGHEEHALSEAKTASRWLHGRSIVVLDDTVYRRREFAGKGALAVPWMLDQGWRVLHSGLQTILVRGRGEAT